MNGELNRTRSAMHDIEMLKFCGKIIGLGEDEFGASFSNKAGDILQENLYRDFIAAGCPKDVKKWLRSHLAILFQWVAERPKWIESTTAWPYFDGKPMIFIRQFEVPNTPLSSAKLAPSVMIYIFGARRSMSEGWDMQYTVVEQHRGFAE